MCEIWGLNSVHYVFFEIKGHKTSAGGPEEQGALGAGEG